MGYFEGEPYVLNLDEISCSQRSQYLSWNKNLLVVYSMGYDVGLSAFCGGHLLPIR